MSYYTTAGGTKLDSRFFKSDYCCKEHNDYKCDMCLDEQEESNGAKVLTLAPLDMVAPDSQPIKNKKSALNQLNEQIEFIKVGLSLTDTQVSKLKVANLDNKLSEAKREITVGNLQKLLKVKEPRKGVVKTLFGISLFKK